MSAIRKAFPFKDLGRLFRHGALPFGDRALLECFLSEGNESALESKLDQILQRLDPLEKAAREK